MSDDLKIKVLSLTHDDILVLSTPHSLSQSMIERITREFKKHYPDNRLMILEQGLTLDGVIKAKKDIQASPVASVLVQPRMGSSISSNGYEAGEVSCNDKKASTIHSSESIDRM